MFRFLRLKNNKKTGFSDSKGVVSYLISRYGKLHNLTRKQEKIIIKKIKMHHNQEEILMMRRRLEGSIDLLKEAKDFVVHPIMIILSFGTVMTSIFISSISLITSFYRGTDDIQTIQRILGSMESISFFLLGIGLFFMAILLTSAFSAFKHIKKYTARRCALILIEESIDPLNKDK